jgi:hypothetical protein
LNETHFFCVKDYKQKDIAPFSDSKTLKEYVQNGFHREPIDALAKALKILQ